MDMKCLQTFIAAARFMNFRRTSDVLYISQPTVTQHIRTIETELGVALFDRSQKQIRLTAAGEEFVHVATEMLASYQEGLSHMQAWRQGYDQRLVIAASLLVARHFLAPIVQRFMTQHPLVDVSILIETSDRIPQMVAEGSADVGLSRCPPAIDRVDGFLLDEDPIVFVAPADSLDHDAPPLFWEEVVSTNRLMTHNHPLYWDDLLLELRQRKLPIRTMRVEYVDVTKRFIQEGLGVSFLPLSTVRSDVAINRLALIETESLALPMAATYVVHSPLTSSAHAVSEFLALLDHYRSMATNRGGR